MQRDTADGAGHGELPTGAREEPAYPTSMFRV